jgi:hypothetical protein
MNFAITNVRTAIQVCGHERRSKNSQSSAVLSVEEEGCFFKILQNYLQLITLSIGGQK